MNHNGKVITISSTKGGVGKTTLVMNLAGIYFLMKKKVLIVDLDLYSGGIATCLNIDSKKDIYGLIDTLSNNKNAVLAEYVTSYNNGIDVLPCPKDPRNVSKIENTYIGRVIDMAKYDYDVVLVDTSHSLDAVCLTAIESSYNSLFVITNDLVDIKNMKSLVNIFDEMEKENYKIVLNNSRDTGRDYISLFDIRKMIKRNIDYTISRNFYIRNIDKYILKGEILTLNKFINRFYNLEIKNMNKLANSLLMDVDGEENGKK